MRSPTAKGHRTLARRYYTGQDVYAAGTRSVFFERWIYAGRASAISGPGSYFLCEIESESVMVLKDSDGEVRAHHNVCRHRGTRLLTEPEGQLPQSIRCPYHAWTYALDGTLIGAPFMDEVGSFCADDYPLNSVSVAVWEGCVFLSLARKPAPFEPALAPRNDRCGPWGR